jgi:tripartite-type tricarboxylate transporter receptor subunit TctC
MNTLQFHSCAARFLGIAHQKFYRRVALACTFMASSLIVQAQPFPAKPITLMVPYAAGGPSDLVARRVNTALSKELGQSVVVENLGGAGGAIAAQKVLDAAADGYYLYQGAPNELILAPLANKAVKYKSEDFIQIQRIVTAPLAIVVRKDLPVSNADELAALIASSAKAGKPMSYASVGNGSIYHLLSEQMSGMLKAPMLHIPYKGSTDILRDLVGGQLDMMITPYSAPLIEFEKQGRFKFIAALSPQRQPLLPHVPSVDEGKALKGFHMEVGTGFYVKRGTPEPIVQTMYNAVSKVMGDAEVRAALKALVGSEASAVLSREAAAKDYSNDIERFKAIAKSINLSQE